MAKNEPQSYGSQSDWLTGKTGEKLTPQGTREEHPDFYESRHDTETNAEDQGGQLSPRQLSENVRPAEPGDDEQLPVQKVTASESGAARDSFFKRRDYDR